MSWPLSLILTAFLLAVTAFPKEPSSFVLRPGAAWQAPPGSIVLRSKITKIIEEEQRRYKPTTDEPVFAPSCIRAPTLSDFFALAEVTGAKRIPSAESGRMPDLYKPSARIVDLFTVLQHTRWGTAVLKKFLPRFGFDIRIEHFSEAMRNEERTMGRNAAAVYDIDKKTIYVDRNAPLGTVAPILLHEIIHSLDNDFARSIERERQLWGDFDERVNEILQVVARRTGKSETQLSRDDFRGTELTALRREKDVLDEFRDVRTYRAERVAYDLYSNIVGELAGLAPTFYRGVVPNSVPLFSDEELIQTERLSPRTIALYQRGLCRTRR